MASEEARQPKQARSVATRERLLDAAVECLIEYGYAGTSTPLVCKRANLSRGAQLHHFATKDELLLAAMEHLARRRFQELSEQARKIVPSMSSDPAKRMRTAIDLLWRTFSADLYFGALELWVAARTNPALRTEVHRIERYLGKEVQALFHDLFPSEITDSREGSEALRAQTYLLRGLALTRLLRDGPGDEERMLDVAAKLLTDVVAPSTTTKTRTGTTKSAKTTKSR